MLKAIELKPGKEAPILRRHPWVFSGAIKSPLSGFKNGDFVEVISHKKEVLARGYFQESSIAVRILQFAPQGPTSLRALFQEKFRNAVQLRKVLPIDHTNTNAFRLIHGEGDECSGLIVDSFNNVLVVQIHSAGLLPHIDIIIDCLHEVVEPDAIIMKSNTTVKDGTNEVVYGSTEPEIMIKEHGMQFYVSPLEGQKTGFFIDQRDSRAFISQLTKDKTVLNLFSYSGGFSIAALRGGACAVTSVDSSTHAITFCEKNVSLLGSSNHTAIDADVFDYLKDTSSQFDLVICDPPAFAKHISAEKAALKGYARLNKAALEKVAPRGLFATFSCSQVVSTASFESAVTSACIELGRPARIIHRFTQSCCHPESLFHPEGRYLKGLLLQLDY